MKKSLIIITTILSSSIILNAYALEQTKCYMPPLSFKHDKNKKYDWFSDHGISITNNTGAPQAYHIVYNHDLGNIMSATPKQFDIELANGQSYSTSERYNTKITMNTTGNYTSNATTQIFMDGKLLSNCVSKNNLTVF